MVRAHWRGLLLLVGTLLVWSRYPTLTFTVWVCVAAWFGTQWVRARYRMAEAEGIPHPSWQALIGMWWVEFKHRSYLRAQWPKFCLTTRLTVGTKEKYAPYLYAVRGNLAGDLTARVDLGAVALPVETLLKHTEILADTVRCRDVVARRMGAGRVDLKFLWTEPLERTLPVADTAVGRKGTVTYGTRRDKAAATIPVGLPVLISGMTGSGKSGVEWSLLGNLNRLHAMYGMRYELWISDAKGGTELKQFANKVGKDMGPFTVRGFAADWKDSAKLIDDYYRALKHRQVTQPFDKWTIEHGAEHPLLVLLVDEVVELMRFLPTASKDKLLTVVSQIRSAGGMPIAGTQLAQKEVLGIIRDMFPVRLSLAQPAPLNTNMALADGAEQAGARCSQIFNQPGFGYSFDETRRGYEPFRAGWCSGADRDRISRGLLPEGMLVPQGREVPRPCAVYRLPTLDGRVGYIGKAVNPERRFKQHQRGAEWAPQIDWENVPEPVWFDSEAEALAAEEKAIKAERPPFNEVHNGGGWLRLPQTPFRKPVERVEVGPPPGPEFWRDPAVQPVRVARDYYSHMGAE